MMSYYVYRFVDKNHRIIYVGRTNDLFTRMSTHFGKNGHLPKACYEQVHRIDYLQVETKNDMKIKELYYISRYRPLFNTVDAGEVSFELNELADAWVMMDDTNTSLLRDISILKKKNKASESKIETLESEKNKLMKKVDTRKGQVAELEKYVRYLEEKSLEKNFEEAVQLLKQEHKSIFIHVQDGKCLHVLYRSEQDEILALHFDYKTMTRHFVSIESPDKEQLYPQLTFSQLLGNALAESKVRACQEWVDVTIPSNVDIEEIHPDIFLTYCTYQIAS
ncbi:nucleotide excision repair endonuclease [Rossellomorea marisflavi]|uniref:nucleotide excision repair endonuclease n=1 Tax=Rossellomorea marisflavi TaxID=189381 RepID=UPI003FA18346